MHVGHVFQRMWVGGWVRGECELVLWVWLSPVCQEESRAGQDKGVSVQGQNVCSL